MVGFDELLPTDDNVRTDGGNSTEDQPVPDEELEKAIRNAARRDTREEPGS